MIQKELYVIQETKQWGYSDYIKNKADPDTILMFEDEHKATKRMKVLDKLRGRHTLSISQSKFKVIKFEREN